MLFQFENTYARLPETFFARVDPTPVAAPEFIAVNKALAGNSQFVCPLIIVP
jgi:hypothetical protein